MRNNRLDAIEQYRFGANLESLVEAPSAACCTSHPVSTLSRQHRPHRICNSDQQALRSTFNSNLSSAPCANVTKPPARHTHSTHQKDCHGGGTCTPDRLEKKRSRLHCPRLPRQGNMCDRFDRHKAGLFNAGLSTLWNVDVQGNGKVV